MLTSGERSAVRVAASNAVMLLSGPVIGLFYAVLMPFIGIATVVILAGRRVLADLYDLAAKSVSFGWTPKNAYLSGKKKRK